MYLNSLPPAFGSADELNQKLNEEIKKARYIVLHGIQKNEDLLKFFKEFYNPFQPLQAIIDRLENSDNENFLSDINKNKNIYFQIDHYIKVKTKKVSADMPSIYRNMKDHLKAFEKFRKQAITFETLNLDFYESFVDFLTYDYVLPRRKSHVVGLKTNTVGKTINQFKTFLKDRIKKGLIASFNMDDWIVFRIEVDAVYLSVKEIKTIMNVSLKEHPHLVDYMNDMVLGCLTGLRFSDFS